MWWCHMKQLVAIFFFLPDAQDDHHDFFDVYLHFLHTFLQKQYCTNIYAVQDNVQWMVLWCAFNNNWWLWENHSLTTYRLWADHTLTVHVYRLWEEQGLTVNTDSEQTGLYVPGPIILIKAMKSSGYHSASSIAFQYSFTIVFFICILPWSIVSVWCLLVWCWFWVLLCETSLFQKGNEKNKGE